MSGDDLSMINLQQTSDGKWSWTAYRKPHQMWRSNKDCADIFECVEQLVGCMSEETQAEEARVKVLAQMTLTSKGGEDKSSGGMKSKPAGVKGKAKR